MPEINSDFYPLPTLDGRTAIRRHILSNGSALYPPQLYLHRTQLDGSLEFPAWYECYDFAFGTILEDSFLNEGSSNNLWKYDFYKNPYTYLSERGYLSAADIRKGDLILYGDLREPAGRPHPKDDLNIIHAGIIYQTEPEVLVESKFGGADVYVHAVEAVSDKYGNYYMVLRKTMNQEQYAEVVKRLESVKVLGPSRDYWAEKKPLPKLRVHLKF